MKVEEAALHCRTERQKEKGRSFERPLICKTSAAKRGGLFTAC
jgi:hypothetical protein